MSYYADLGADMTRNLNPQRHLLARWDAKKRRYICDCGHASKTGTDHDRHAHEALGQTPGRGA